MHIHRKEQTDVDRKIYIERFEYARQKKRTVKEFKIEETTAINETEIATKK